MSLAMPPITQPIMPPSAKPRRTPDDLERDGEGFELIDGKFVEKPPMAKVGGDVTTALNGELYTYLKGRPIAKLYGSEQGFECFPRPGDRDRVRKPDVSVVLKERVAADAANEGWFKIRPDIAVEVISTNDKAGALRGKLRDYQLAQVPLVWVIYPIERLLEVHRPDDVRTVLYEDDVLDGETILPGFRVRVGDLLPPPQRRDEPAPQAS